MKTRTPSASGRILEHAEGTGLLTTADLKARTQEIALINGRSTPNDADRDQAKRELRGDNLPPTSDKESTSSRGLTRDPSEPTSNYGSEKPSQEPEDGQNASERMVVEGMEEAQHDQMVAARRRRR